MLACHLRGWKSCTKVNFGVEFHENPPTAQYSDAGDRHIFRFVTFGALFAQTPGLHFEALHGSSFVLVCYLRGCKSRTKVNFGVEFHEYPPTAQYAMQEIERFLGSQILVRCFHKPRVYIYKLSMALALRWYAIFMGANPAPKLILASNFMNFHLLPNTRYRRSRGFPVRNFWCVVSTNPAFTFISSPWL